MEKEKPATVEYHGVQIIYDEERDRWSFELRGISRHAGSLRLAKAAIDRPIPEKKRPFEKMAAYTRPRFRSDEVVLATVTGIAGKRYGGTLYMWVSIPGGGSSRPDREQVALSMLYAANEANKERIARIEVIDAEIGKLHEERARVLGAMDPLKIPSDVETPEEE